MKCSCCVNWLVVVNPPHIKVVAELYFDNTKVVVIFIDIFDSID